MPLLESPGVIAITTVEDVQRAVVVCCLGVKTKSGTNQTEFTKYLEVLHIVLHLHLDTVALVILATLELLVSIPETGQV